MVFCTYCGQSFTRDEHLERHILTHTNVKPFKCFTCHMSFARRDLLQRHYTVHGRNPSQEGVPVANAMMARTAGRTPIACSNCAKTKTKCDKKFPCSRCASRNLKCTLRPTRRSTKNAARLGLITAETLAQDVANGILGPDQTIAAEKVPLPMGNEYPSEQAVQPQQNSPAQHGASGSSSPGDASPFTSRHTSTDGSLGPGLEPFHGCPTPPHGLSPAEPLPAQLIDGSGAFAGFDDFPRNANKMSDGYSPRFMLDWQQMQMPMGMDSLLGEHDLDFNMGSLGLGADAMGTNLSIDPSLGSAMVPSLLTPLETPELSRPSSEYGMDGLQDPSYPLLTTEAMVAGLQPSLPPDPVVLAQDGWTAFRCVPPSNPNACPSTARWNLEALENSLRNHDQWRHWRPRPEQLGSDAPEHIAVMQLHESTRDTLLAITQGFLHKALDIHRGQESPQNYVPSNFILLPPTKVLEYFLRSYTTSFESLYPLTSKGSLDANELMFCYHDRVSSLLILLMVAQGAMNVGSDEARTLTGGLVEACRISLFDLIEKNVAMASDHNVLHAALIFTDVASWCGDKWQMDIAMGQRGIYTSMLRHSRVLDHQYQQPAAFDHGQGDKDQAWNVWVQQEGMSRLVYSWAMVDQELALFHDTNLSFSVTEFGIALPHSDELWRAKSSSEWATALNGGGDGASSAGADNRGRSATSSLRDLFRHFLDDELDSLEQPLTALHLRLLLIPLQAMVSHHSQVMSCFSTSPSSSRTKNKAITASSTRCRLEEVQCLLQRWHGLALALALPPSPTLTASLILYHLICLNTVTSMPDIERLARREAFDGTYQSLLRAHRSCIAEQADALFHAGQVLRLVRAMPRPGRPSWWAAAVYRVALVLWCDSLIDKAGAGSNKNGPDPSSTIFASSCSSSSSSAAAAVATTTSSSSRSSSSSSSSSSPPPSSSKPVGVGAEFAIDALAPEHPAIQRWLNKGEGRPVLTKRDGTHVAIDHGTVVLGHCGEVLEEGLFSGSRFVEGIRSRLERLRRT